MPKWRKLHTKILDSFDFAEMPDDFTRLLWTLLPLILDRCGRGIDNPAWIRSRAFPLREDVSIDQVKDAMDWYADRGMIERYENDGRGYFWIPTWHDYQGSTSREGESDLPAPPGYEDPAEAGKSTQEQVASNSGATQEQLTSNSGVTPERVSGNSELDVDVDVEGDIDVDKEGDVDARDARPSPSDHKQMFASLAELCQIDLNTMTDRQRGMLNQSEKRLRKSGADPGDLENFADWWYDHDWRGEKGDPPMPHQVREEWGKFTAWRNGHGEEESDVARQQKAAIEAKLG